MPITIDGSNGISDVRSTTDGSAATPAIRGTDTNTGIFFPAADTIAFSEGGAEAMRLDSSGNLAVGTTSVTSGAKVQVDNPSSNVILSVGKDKPVSLFSRFNDAPAMYWISGEALRFAHTTDGVGIAGFAERMRIDSSGIVCIGIGGAQISGAEKFTVRGMTSLVGLTGSSTVNVATTGSGSETFINFGKNSGASSVGTISTNGTTTSYNTTSDYRLKENIAPMTGALAKIQQLKPVTYKWKSDNSDGQGFIAHELQAVVPDCVTGEKDAVDDEGNPVYQGIDTSFLVATLTAAIQELKTTVDAQAARIAALENPPVESATNE
jgi:hypothetical protein